MRDGLVEVTARKQLRLTPAGQQAELKLAGDVPQDIACITHTYGHQSSRALIDLVYKKYPWYSINSQFPERRCMARPVAPCAIYTLGYMVGPDADVPSGKR